MLICAFYGMSIEEWLSSKALLSVGLTLACIGSLFVILLRGEKISLKPKDGYIISLTTWVFCSLAGSIPFIILGYPVSSSIFESVAAFTTTGCTVFDLNFMPKSLILWRAISNWLGGIGVLVLVVTMFQTLGVNAKSLVVSESSASSFENLGNRFSDTSKFLYITYAIFTLLEFVLLAAGPLSSFDAIINTFASISTSGLIITAANSSALFTNYSRAIILLFTILTSLNFYLYYYLLKGKWKKILGNMEVKTFLLIIAFASLLVGADLYFQGGYHSIRRALWDAVCQVASFISTAGYPIVNYTRWPMFATMILFSLVLIGGCSMSTSGSLKVIRIVTLFKLIERRIFKQVHPNGIRPIKIDGKPVPSERVSSITTHIMLFFMILICSCIILGFNNLDLETTITTVLGLFTTTGLSLGMSGSSGFFGMFSPMSMYFMSLLMIAGRLEIYTILIMFTKSFWLTNRANVI